MFKKILVANRGEIALRIQRACRELGIKAVMVYSEADRDAKYVKLADEAVCIGPAPSPLSYLNMPAIISAAEVTDAGQRLYEIIGHTLRAMEEFRGTCAGRPVELMVGAGESLIQWLLLPRLTGLTEAHPRLAVTFQNLKTDEIVAQLLHGELDFGILTRSEPNRHLASAPLGRLEFGLFAPAHLLPASPKVKLKSDVLGQLPLAMLEGSAGIRNAVEAEAHQQGFNLNIRLRFSSYPQLAQAVQSMGVAAIMPRLAEKSLADKNIRVVPLPFLSPLTRQVSLVWNQKTAEVRPVIAKYARLLPPIFRMTER